MNRVERPNITTWDRPEPPDWRSGCTFLLVAVIVAFIAGYLIGSASRPAQATTPATSAVESDDRQALRLTLTPTVATASASRSASPEPTGTPHRQGTAVPVSPAPSPPPARATPKPTRVVKGIASHMGSTQGFGYLALPQGPGHRVRICGAGGCVDRTSTDAGPDKAMQRAGRVADLYVGDFVTVCGKPASAGLCTVTVEYR